MNFMEILHTYFRGEKLEALWFILPAGVLLVVLGLVALKAEKGGFAWGVAVPCFLFGAILIVTGATVGFRTDRQVAELEQAYQDSPAEMVRAELPRMQKVNANFRATFYLFGVIALVGLLVHYLVPADWGRAFGAVLILGGAVGLLIDGFAERRAVPYTQALEHVARHTAPAAVPTPGGSP